MSRKKTPEELAAEEDAEAKRDAEWREDHWEELYHLDKLSNLLSSQDELREAVEFLLRKRL